MKSIYLPAFLEKGNSYLATTKVLNACVQAPVNLPRIGTTTVYNTLKQTTHKVASTTSIPQTDKNNLTHITEGSYALCAYLCLFDIIVAKKCHKFSIFLAGKSGGHFCIIYFFSHSTTSSKSLIYSYQTCL